jgi:hypothetical protein
MNTYREFDAGGNRMAKAFIALGSRARIVAERRPCRYKRAGWDVRLTAC